MADHVIEIDSGRVVRTLALVAVALIVASLVVDFTAIRTGHDRIFGLLPLFDVDREGNVPTFFSAVLLLLAGLVCGVTGVLAGQTARQDRIYWRALAFMFVYMAVDEASLIHELSIAPLHGLMRLGPAFRFAWVIPGMILVAVVGLVFLRFYLRQPAETRRGIAIAAVLYVVGAIGFEIVSGSYISAHRGGERDPAYILIFTAEESLEMAGMIVFIGTMLRHIAGVYQDGRWRVLNRSRTATPID